MGVLQQKLAKKDGGEIDRSQDIARIQEFYKRYREKHRVDELQEEEMKLQESGTFSGDLQEYVSYENVIVSFLLWVLG
jgi:callose synthase